jgi:GMP synthase (glutamine-hydrolysing)
MNTVTRPVDSGVLVLDYGSQYTLLIARRLREIGVYAEVIDGGAKQPPADFKFDGIILSGGPDSVTAVEARGLPDWVLASQKPVLGICYGMQLLMREFGGVLRSGKGREYGAATLELSPEMPQKAAKMFYGLPTRQHIWMSHGDDVEQMPADFSKVGFTEAGVVAAVVHKHLPIAGLQFHPEVQHTEFGQEMLQLFLKQVCRASFNWQTHDMTEAIMEHTRQAVGKGKVLMAVSGGVDSTVAVTLLAKALGPENVTALFVDHGLLRLNERQWVADNFRFLGVKKLEILDREALFMERLAGIKDPEEKRKIIGRTFIEVFEDFAKQHTDEFTHLGQGTLYPDVIESAGHGSGSKVIKSHHNVGGLPERLDLQLVEPFRYLFKDEVRSIGRDLGIPDALVKRHPFPGPGLAVRIPGAVSKEDCDLLRAADHIFIQALQEEGYYDQVWQAFAVLLPVRSVGVMGDNRTYQKACALRAVTASDGMTAGVGDLPMSFLTKVADRIVRNVDGINRVVYDITSKPPATIEWE